MDRKNSKIGRATYLLLAVAILLSSYFDCARAESKSNALAEEPTAFRNQPKHLLGGNNDVWSVAWTPDGKQNEATAGTPKENSCNRFSVAVGSIVGRIADAAECSFDPRPQAKGDCT